MLRETGLLVRTDRTQHWSADKISVTRRICFMFATSHIFVRPVKNLPLRICFDSNENEFKNHRPSAAIPPESGSSSPWHI